MGFGNINSFKLNYTVSGGPTQIHEVTGVNIEPNEEYSFVHNIQN